MSYSSLIALHLIHHVGVFVQNTQRWQQRIISDLHESDFTFDLVERIKVVTKRAKKFEMLDDWLIDDIWSVYIPFDLKLLDYGAFWPDLLQMVLF